MAETCFAVAGSVASAAPWLSTDSLSERKLAPKLVLVRDNSRENLMLQVQA